MTWEFYFSSNLHLTLNVVDEDKFKFKVSQAHSFIEMEIDSILKGVGFIGLLASRMDMDFQLGINKTLMSMRQIK